MGFCCSDTKGWWSLSSIYTFPLRHELEFLVRHTLRHVPWLLLGLDTQLVSTPQFGQTIFVSRRVGLCRIFSRKLIRSVKLLRGLPYKQFTYDAAVAKVQLPYSLDHDEPWSWFQNVDCRWLQCHWATFIQVCKYNLFLLILQYDRYRMASRFQSWHVQPKEEIAYEKAATEVWPSHGVLCVLGVKWEDQMLAMAINGHFYFVWQV